MFEENTEILRRIQKLERALDISPDEERQPQSLRGTVARLGRRVAQLEQNNELLRETILVRLRRLERDHYGWVAVEQANLDVDMAATPRIIPTRIYSIRRTARVPEALLGGIVVALDAIAFDLVAEHVPQQGSIFQRFSARSRDALSQPEVRQRLAKLERAIELQAVARPQAEVDDAQARAAATLLSALAEEDEAVAQIGSILAIRYRDIDGTRRTFVRSLTVGELNQIERDPGILARPRDLVRGLPEGPDTPLLR
jgi:hypothetical protein